MSQKKIKLIALVIIQFFLLINFIPSQSYILHETNSLIENSRIEEEKGVKSLIGSGLNLLIGFLSIKQIGIVSAQDYWCCPETNEGVICQNIPSGDYSSCKVNPIFSSCENTARCKVGTCIDKEEGVCSVGTGYACEDEWSSDSINDIEECTLGCCILEEGTKKEYIRKIGCSKKGGVFDTSIPQIECRVSTQEMGACILDEVNCKLTTGDDCELNLRGDFYKGSLCSNPDLETSCESSEKTTCYNDKVYFLDSCGNLANIYNSNKIKDPNYWKYIQEPECSVEVLGDGSIDTPSAKICGNCDSLTSMCDSSSEAGISPTYGDYACKDLNCEDEEFFSKFNRNPMNQESWCVYESYIGDSKDVVGSEYRVAYCDKGKIKVESCGNYRGRICGEKTVTSSEGRELSLARCRFNEGWRCYSVELEAYEFDDDGWLIGGDETKSENRKKCEAISDCTLQSMDLHFPPGGDSVHMQMFDICVPKYPPGLEFWKSSSNSKYLCESLNSAKCTTSWTKWGNYWCVGNCACLSQDFADQMNDLCISLGDCGGYVNVEGVYTKNFKTFNIDKDMPDGKDFERESYIETSPNYIYFGSDELGEFGRGNINGNKKNEYIEYAKDSNIGAGDPPDFFSSTEEGVFGGDPLEGLGFVKEGWEMKKIISTVTAAIVATTAIVVCAVVLVAIGSTGIGLLIDIIIVVIAAIIIIILWLLGGFDDPITVEVEFSCKPWQAPIGGSDCKKCDDDPLRPCTEYKCRSLGSTCRLETNIYESENPICISTGDDSNPPIIIFDNIQNQNDYTTTEINNGVQIRGKDGGCIQEFSLMNFTLKTKDEEGEEDYARCVYNLVGGTEPPFLTNDYYLDGEEFVEGNFYSITHSFDGRLPLLSNSHITNLRGEIGEREGDLNMYVRCMDPSGNYNFNEYVVNLCLKEGPDITPARIIEYSPKDQSFIAYGKNESSLKILLDEPADCVWNYDIDKSYDEGNNFTYCEDYTGQLKSRWECSTTLTNLNKDENKIYLKCKDQPWISESGYNGSWSEEDRNVNIEGYLYTLYATKSELQIDSISPQGEVEKGPILASSVKLEVITSGGAYSGKAKCEYEFIEPQHSGDFFFQTGGTQHRQELNPAPGNYDVLITCTDDAGNKAQGDAIFSLVVDSEAPEVTRAYKEGDFLKIITDEEAKCYYDLKGCSFTMESGNSITTAFSTIHSVEWKKGVTYYIKCKDIFDNISPDCTKKIIPSS